MILIKGRTNKMKRNNNRIAKGGVTVGKIKHIGERF